MTSTIAARCAAMSSAIAQIILDASSFARQLRDSRHYMNAVNADLLSIKLSLDIARDDFSAARTRFPIPLVEAMAGFLDFCVTSTEALHKPIIRLSAGEKRREAWHIFSERESQGIRQDLEALRSALDLVLDLVVLPHDCVNDRTSSPIMKKYRIDGQSASPETSILRRIDVEREHIEALTEGRCPTLCASFDKLRNSAKILLEEQEVAEERQKRSDSRSDSLEPEMGDQPRSTRERPPSVPSPASPSGIGAWIANVLSQKLLSPTLPPDALTLSDPRNSIRPRSRERQRERARHESTPSQGTFYAESTTSGTQTQSSGNPKSVKPKSHTRTDSPQIIVETSSSKANRLTQYTTTTEISIIHQKLTNDKIAISKERRKQLTRNQRVTVDRKLRDISRTSTALSVERIFFEGANPNVAHPEFGTLVIRAAYELPTDVLKLLIEYGADITRTAKTSYYSALHAAVLGRNLENLQFLLSFAASDPSLQAFPLPPTPTASKFNAPASIVFSIDTPNANGETPLHLAARTPGGYEIARWLLEMGADVNRLGPLGATPLQVAVAMLDSRERSAMVQLLMAHGADGEVEGESAGGCERRGKGLSVLGII
ncbi:ankyrin [Byssothecium circinans]|uniref:Ankyrin n=1 Tax=Byssothecium circinans TaxID=147558 RepID=A0A6A5TTH7_9PLEO|nr:ankyrin [Byssothecium circinans]